MKKKLTITITYAIIFCLLLNGFGSIQAENVNNVLKKNLNSTYLCGNTSKENSSWYIIKISSNSSIRIHNLVISFNITPEYYLLPEFVFIITDFQSITFSRDCRTLLTVGGDQYLHINFGPINVEHNHIDNFRYGHSMDGTIPFNFSNKILGAGDWYLIWYATPGKCDFSFAVNMSSEEEIYHSNHLEGSSSFKFETIDFHGNLVYFKYKGYLWYKIFNFLGFDKLANHRNKDRFINAEKKIPINNTFIGRYSLFEGYYLDRTKLKVITPNNDILEFSYRIRFGKKRVVKDDFNPFDPGDFIIGGKGVWKLNVNRKFIGKIPEIQFFGADITIPE